MVSWKSALSDRRSQWSCPPEWLIAGLSLWWLVLDHQRLFATLSALAGPQSGALLVSWAVGVFAIHALLLGLLGLGKALRPVAALLALVAAVSSYYVDRYGVYLDPSMMRNVLHTQKAEARELLGWSLLWHVLAHAGPPWLVLTLLPLPNRRWSDELTRRAMGVVTTVLLLLGVVFTSFQPLASMMRNHKELRYLVLPAAPLWSMARASISDARAAAGPRRAIGEDATRAAPDGQRPQLLVMVVGETARGANWGLNGYSRQTTPGLAQRAVINFPQVTSCGTNTEVSVPCLFAPVGRRDYDEQRIRRSESLLHVLSRAGVGVEWIDNQTGCKGVCDGLPTTTVAQRSPAGLCDASGCLDEGLLAGVEARLQTLQGAQVLVLHMLGNHGPSYYRRYPRQFARFQPDCRDDELHRCSRQAIVNAYDNALLYTDHVLSRLIDLLAAWSDRVDSAMLYVSDHGESLGEKGLYLHGLPYAIAPSEQTHVPMVLWLSAQHERRLGLERACLDRVAQQPARHDHVFHTVLGLMSVSTSLYEPSWDLTAFCRGASTAASSEGTR